MTPLAHPKPRVPSSAKSLGLHYSLLTFSPLQACAPSEKGTEDTENATETPQRTDKTYTENTQGKPQRAHQVSSGGRRHHSALRHVSRRVDVEDLQFIALHPEIATARHLLQRLARTRRSCPHPPPRTAHPLPPHPPQTQIWRPSRSPVCVGVGCVL